MKKIAVCLSVLVALSSFSNNCLVQVIQNENQKIYFDDEIKINQNSNCVQFYLFADVSSQQGKMKITDKLGQVVLSEKVELLNGVCFKWISVSDLNPGEYEIVLSVEEDTFSSHFTL